MNDDKRSIWRGKVAIWSAGLFCLILTEAVVFYFKTSRHQLQWWSMSTFYIPIMISLPFSAGVNFFSKLARIEGVANNRKVLEACSKYIACIVFVAQGTVFICVANGFLLKY